MSLNLFWGVLGYNLFIIVMAVPALPWIIFQLSLVARRRIGLSQRLGKSPAGGGRGASGRDLSPNAKALPWGVDDPGL